MGQHFGQQVKNRATKKEWLPLAAQAGKLANEWASRDDLVAYVGEDGGQGIAAALFDPKKAEIEINTIAAFGKGAKPQHIGDLTERSVQFEHARAAGAIKHEAAHAEFTTFDLRTAYDALKDNRAAYDALLILEESRIEGCSVRKTPRDRSFLRACALNIVLSDMDDEKVKQLSRIRQAAHLSALSLARVDAGVLEPQDVTAIREKIEEIIPADTLSTLNRIWKDFQKCNADRDIQKMYKLAREWAEAVKDAADEAGEQEQTVYVFVPPQPGEGQGQDGEGQDGEGQGQPQPGEQGEGEGQGQGISFGDLMDAISEDAGFTGIDAADEAAEQKQTEEWEAEAERKAQEAAEGRDHKQVAENVFNPNHQPAKSSGDVYGRTNSRLLRQREPSGEERAAAVKIAKMLERAKYQDRIRVEAASYLPPGRLRTRAIVQETAFRERNIAITVEPFQRVQRKHVDDPTLTVGIMTDVSGSMSAAMEPQAVSAWVFSEAVRRIQGRAASVYYGTEVFPGLRPGEHLDKVRVFDAADGSEWFSKAFKALDGALNLLHGNGARLLVICSDGHYGRSGEDAAVRKYLRACQNAGVAVLWLGYNGPGRDRAEDYCAETDAVHVNVGRSVTAAALAIGQAAEAAINKASVRRNGV